MIFLSCDAQVSQKKVTDSSRSSYVDSGLSNPYSKNEYIPNIEGGGGQELAIFYSRFKTLIANNDSLSIADEVFYPLHTALEGHKGTLNIKDKKTFLKYYPQLLNDRMKNFILKLDLHDLFSNWQGICLGHGRIWIDQRLIQGELITKIITISNLDVYWK